jgi:hypothetical protein
MSLQARVLRKALELIGTESKLADLLRVTPHDLATFLAGTASPTQSIFLCACDILREHGQADFLNAIATQSRQDRS